MIIQEELLLNEENLGCKYLVEIRHGVEYLFILCDDVMMINNELLLLVNGFLKQKISQFDYWFVYGAEDGILI